MCGTKDSNIPNAKSVVIYQRGKKMTGRSRPIPRGLPLPKGQAAFQECR